MLFDTNIAIHLREGDAAVLGRFAALDEIPSLSIVTMVELFGGVATAPEHLAARRQQMTLKMAERFTIIPFERGAAEAYLAIVRQIGFLRGRVLDRMIAATAIVAGQTLATINIRDFRDIPGLQLEDWSQ